MKNLLYLLALSLTLYSCSVTKEYATTRTQDINPSPIITIPKVAKVDFTRERVSSTIEKTQRKGKDFNFRSTVEGLALMDALAKSGADLLIEPTYHTTVKTTLYKEKVTATVTGFPAKYTEIRDLTPADTSLIKTMNLLKSTPASDMEDKAPAKKALGIF